ncbi:quercetin 2,3-dioxygenase [Amycolatopsis roodepoortensis]|uniref:quercetin 2,3-dioxygenase n=1 Tax=Amycolatopsis roodepoortensis TaxID=700274 RepID=UPI00214B691F|nr:quercetin 2,3-dioxygenase [Amycolatopsis roodepoortensis]UUV31550.1 quercetin 2,3-dioxygenase [Amycolatopsis roodepoortensis]
MSQESQTIKTTRGQVVHTPAGEGQTLWVMGDTYTIKATEKDTNGALSLIEASVPPGEGPPPHWHAREDEAYYLLSGSLEVLGDDRTFMAHAGDFVFIPRGTRHRFKNVGLHTARLLFLFTPGGFEGYFTKIGHPAKPGELPPPLTEADVQRSADAAPEYGVHVTWDDSALHV